MLYVILTIALDVICAVWVLYLCISKDCIFKRVVKEPHNLKWQWSSSIILLILLLVYLTGIYLSPLVSDLQDSQALVTLIYVVSMIFALTLWGTFVYSIFRSKKYRRLLDTGKLKKKK